MSTTILQSGPNTPIATPEDVAEVAADLRYALVVAPVATTYSVPDAWFPITFTHSGTAYTVQLMDTDMIVVNDGHLEYHGLNGEFVSMAYFNGAVLNVIAPNVSSLQFNGVTPVEGETALDATTTATLADRAVNLITAEDETSIDIELPAAVTVDGVSYARDFFLDIDNSANASDLALEFTALGVDYAFVPLEDDSISEMMTISSGERVRLYFTETPYHATGSLPVLNVARVTLGDFVTSTTTQGGN